MAASDALPQPAAEEPAASPAPSSNSNSAEGGRAAEDSHHEEEEVSQEFECVICMKILLLPVTTPCGHNFCKGCIDEAVSYRPCCPLCRCPLLLSGAADPVTGLSTGSALRVNTLLQQLLERNYPRTMYLRRQYEEERRQEAAARRRMQQRHQAARLRAQHAGGPLYAPHGPLRDSSAPRAVGAGGSAVPGEGAAVDGGSGTRRTGEENRPEQILTLLRIFNQHDGFSGGARGPGQPGGAAGRAARPSWRGTSRAAAVAARAAPLFPGESISLHVYQEEYVRLVELSLRNARTLGVIYPTPPQCTTPPSSLSPSAAPSHSWVSSLVQRVLGRQPQRACTDNAASADTPTSASSVASALHASSVAWSSSARSSPSSSDTADETAVPRRGGNASGLSVSPPEYDSRVPFPSPSSAPEYGCCVQIEQHTPLEPEAGGAPGRCLIRCVCRNRFRVRNKIFLEDWAGQAAEEQERGVPASSLPYEGRGSQSDGREGSEAASAARLDREVGSESRLLGEPASDSPSAPEGGFYYEIGYCEPIFDEGDREEVPGEAAGRGGEEPSASDEAAVGPASEGVRLRRRAGGAEETTGEELGDPGRDLHETWIESQNNWGPLTRASDLAHERAGVVHALEVWRRYRTLAGVSSRGASAVTEGSGEASEMRNRLTGAGPRSREIARELRERCQRRLCEICIEGLERQLQQAGDVAQRLFASKFGRIPSLSSRRMTAYDLEKFSFFVAKVIVSSPSVRWQWFLLTDTTQRLLELTKVITEARWMNILALNTTPLSSLSRFLLFQDFHSNVLLFVIFVCAVVVFKIWPSLFFDDDFF
ncbi:putative zinc finger (C3HC4 RING finger) protein [Neospora caninum Liverpool]|uniref:Putative zinc finger (C3HC4 RING finger) protein n=1 Tax=Neospora caninum (strain Liverpool) TaxID=572307 RepID=F0VF64_NEOCL|nr:putative zinc finger (C3HC4 RING finger) protein [Neospora caninum Liverpool]CBZ52358.1 putative zinc finger (C3HC4 RING finger) protein [Neospora caninum Liverpool]CEL66328.1 TPA: zinc finger (C3HC4 RING finger) protein,putative [Neospora caninum Liverpool]|eukprot:XP_003882390.1 putative zinc finger (C3HC4 RING finger) protein [Neospora caninum Liverpool]